MLGAQEQKSTAAHLTACITAEQEVVLQGLDGSAQEAGEHVRVIAHMDAVLQYQRELSNIVAPCCNRHGCARDTHLAIGD